MSDAINSIQAGYVGEDVESVIELLLQVLCPPKQDALYRCTIV